MWKSVVNSINLSEQQKLNIVQWKQLFMQKVRDRAALAGFRVRVYV